VAADGHDVEKGRRRESRKVNWIFLAIRGALSRRNENLRNRKPLDSENAAPSSRRVLAAIPRRYWTSANGELEVLFVPRRSGGNVR
jgi:hypothetical protein